MYTVCESLYTPLSMCIGLLDSLFFFFPERRERKYIFIFIFKQMVLFGPSDAVDIQTSPYPWWDL